MFEGLSMYEAFHEAYLSYPHGLALYYMGKKFSYSKLNKYINRYADIFVHTLHLKKGDTILIAQPNIPYALILFYAANKVGIICNFVHPFTPFNQIKNIFERTNSKYAFLFEQRVAKEVEKYRDFARFIFVTRIEDFLPLGKKFIYHTFLNRKIRKKLGRYLNKFEGFKYVYQLKGSKVIPDTLHHFDKETCILLHSGSTTGAPKTICLSSSAFNFLAAHACEFVDTTPEKIKGTGMLSVLPSFHGFGLCMTMHAPIVNRFACVLMPKFSPQGVAKLMKKTYISVICGVPSMYESLLKCDEFISNPELKKLMVCFCGGDSMSISLKQRFDEAMKNKGSTCQIFEGYGLTEAIAVNSVNTYSHHKDGSIGYPASGVTFKILGENNEFLKPGEVGEILIKTPSRMNGYFLDEEATQATFFNEYLKTGDLGYMDEDGYIYFAQRKKRVVKVSGVGVFPTEIEKLVQTVPGVKEVCAIEIPDDKLIHAIKIFVVATYFDKEGMKENIIDTCRKYLIRWAVPKEIEFVDKLPLTLLGKVDFNKLQIEENERRGIKNNA